MFLNTIKDLKKKLKPNKYKKVFILTGKKSFFSSGINKLIEKSLTTQKSFFYFKTSKIPEIDELKKIIIKINKFKPDLILAIGGGTVLDLAKIANSFDNVKNLHSRIIGSKYKIKKKRPLFAIPTTAGSGAEITANAVIYINKIKYSVEDNSLIPNFYLLVPKVIINLDRKIKASSGFDAIAQSIESLFSKKSNSKSLYFAKKSLRISLSNYINFVKKPSISNTYKMCIAANLSGRAISISKTTAPHALSYPFTSYLGIDHGHAVSLTFIDFLKFNYKNLDFADTKFNLKDRYNLLFKLTKSKNIDELENYVLNLLKNVGLETDLNKLKINIEKFIPKILKGVNFQRLANNPVKLSILDIKSILKNK
tara:strand:- start:326 stop:1426 length:1101 start_codon:yes stop_codon:yes gene_type:complete